MSDNPKCPNTPKYPCGDCPVCQVPPAAPHRLWSWPPGFHEAWPTREAIAAHQGGTGRWLVTDPYGVKTLGLFDGDTFHVLMRWHVVGAMASEPTQPWKFEPYAGEQIDIAYQRDKRDVEHEVAAMGLHETTLGGLHSQDEVESVHPAGWQELLRRHYERAPAPPAASDSPSRPQAPASPEGPAAGPGIVPRLDTAGFGSWPSEEEIEAHGNGLWLIRQKGEMAPGQIRSMALGRFGKEEGRTVWWSGGNFSHREHMSAWTFCPIDDNGDKLDAAPVLRGEDARRLVEQLGQVAPPEEIARRRAEAGRRLAESEAAAERLAVERMNKAGRQATESLRRLNDPPIETAPKMKPPERLPAGAWQPPPPQDVTVKAMTGDLERQQDALKALNLRPLSNPTPHRATCKYVGLRDGKACACNIKYAVPVGPAGFENDRIGRIDHAARMLATLPERSPDRRVLVVLRGLPGSGKSTVAQAIVDSDPGRWARVSKDDVRQMMVGPSGDLFRHVEDRAREVVVTKTAEEMTMSALRLGLDVVVDATNLTNKALNSWRMAAMVVNRDGRGPVLVCERVVPTSVEECVARDARRGARSVGRAVIERLAATIDVPLEDRNQEVGQ